MEASLREGQAGKESSSPAVQCKSSTLTEKYTHICLKNDTNRAHSKKVRRSHFQFQENNTKTYNNLPTLLPRSSFKMHLRMEKQKRRRRRKRRTIVRRSSENPTYKNTLTGVKCNHPGFDGSSQKRRKEQSVCQRLRSPRRSNFAPHLNVAAQHGTERRAGEVKGGWWGGVVVEGPGGGKSTARLKKEKKRKDRKSRGRQAGRWRSSR